MNEEVVDRPNFHWVEIGATTQVYWRELPDVPYTDEDGTGTFHIDIVWDNHSTSLPIPAGMLAVDLIFEPEYPA